MRNYNYSSRGNRLFRQQSIVEDDDWTIDQRQPRQQQYNYYRRNLNCICGKTCQSIHQKCCMYCKYCHSLHLKTSLINNICPNIFKVSNSIRENKSYQCQQCEGSGHFQKQVQTVLFESKQRFQNRSAFYIQKGLNPPERKIYKKQKHNENVACEKCLGKGKIYKITNCCDEGCRLCGYSKYVINPAWIILEQKNSQKMMAIYKSKMESQNQNQLNLFDVKKQKNDEVFPCRICQKKVQLSQLIVKLRCGHAFHSDCILQKAKNSPVCYICGLFDDDLINIGTQNDIKYHDLNNESLSQKILELQRKMQRQIISFNDIKFNDIQQNKSNNNINKVVQLDQNSYSSYSSQQWIQESESEQSIQPNDRRKQLQFNNIQTQQINMDYINKIIAELSLNVNNNNQHQ